jgi:hypothetical protein
MKESSRLRENSFILRIIPTVFKSISPELAVRAGQAIRVGWATSDYPGKPSPNSRQERGIYAASTLANPTRPK